MPNAGSFAAFLTHTLCRCARLEHMRRIYQYQCVVLALNNASEYMPPIQDSHVRRQLTQILISAMLWLIAATVESDAE